MAVSILVVRALVRIFKSVLIREIGRQLEGWVFVSDIVAVFICVGIVEVVFNFYSYSMK